MYLVDQWGRQVADPDGRLNYPYLVGSVMAGGAYRDVDVRLMLDTREFEELTGGDEHRLRALNVAFTLWGQKVTGMLIDFQFQDTDKANAEHDGVRSALGLRPRSPRHKAHETFAPARRLGLITGYAIQTEPGEAGWFNGDKLWDVTHGTYDEFRRDPSPPVPAALRALLDALDHTTLEGWAVNLNATPHEAEDG